MQKIIMLITLGLLCSCLYAWDDKAKTELFAFKNDPKNLQLFFEEILKAKQNNNLDRAAKLSHSLVPTMESVKKVIKEDTQKEVWEKLEKYVQMANTPPQNDFSKYAMLFQVGKNQTQVKVHGATTEQILANEEDSVVWQEFPGGAVKSAVLFKAKETFYEVEVLEPGKDVGIKYHLFFWDGKKWKMLGKIWRLL